MRNFIEKKAEGWYPSAFSKSNLMHLHSKPAFKRRPGFSKDLIHCKGSTILIAVDWDSLHAWRLKSICLLCNDTQVQYDLRCCHLKDVFVFYSNKEHFQQALCIGYEAQRQGAKSVFLKFQVIHQGENYHGL